MGSHSTRICWVDNARAIGILLVVLGHTKGLEISFKELIYSFHMPLFFFLSGFLLKENYLEVTFSSFILRNIQRLIVPYVIFWIVSYLYWLPHEYLLNRTQQSPVLSPLDPFVGLILGTGNSLYVNAVLWFFTCLFCTSTLFYWVSKAGNKKVTLSILVALGPVGPLIYQYVNARMPWNLELALVAMVFYGSGNLISKSQMFGTVNRSKLRLPAIPILCVILLLTVRLNGGVNMNEMEFGNIALFYLGAFTGISITILISQIIAINTIFEWLSTNAIVIYPLHPLILSAFTGIGVLLFGLDYRFKETMIFSALYTIGALTVCFPTSYIVRNYFPWAIGRTQTYPSKLALLRPKANMQ